MRAARKCGGSGGDVRERGGGVRKDENTNGMDVMKKEKTKKKLRKAKEEGEIKKREKNKSSKFFSFFIFFSLNTFYFLESLLFFVLVSLPLPLPAFSSKIRYQTRMYVVLREGDAIVTKENGFKLQRRDRD